MVKARNSGQPGLAPRKPNSIFGAQTDGYVNKRAAKIAPAVCGKGGAGDLGGGVKRDVALTARDVFLAEGDGY